MKSIELIQRLHRHREWANRQLLRAVSSLDGDQLHRGFPMGQGSIWKSLTHLYAAEFVWLDALLGNEEPVAPGDARGKLPGNQEGEHQMRSLPELRSRWEDLEKRWGSYLAMISPDSLSDNVYKRSSLTGERLATRRSDILIHVCTHAQYTTAQVVNMLRHVGVTELPDAMLISLARSESENADIANPDRVSFASVAESDFEELVTIRIAAMRDSLEAIGRFDPTRARDRLRKSFYPEDTKLIRLDGQTVGFYTFRRDEDACCLEHLYVLPSYQSRGVGSFVLRQLLASPIRKHLRVLVVALKESASNRFYVRHGFSKTSEDQLDNYYAHQNPVAQVVLSGHIVVPDSDLDSIRTALQHHIAATRAELGCLQFEVEEDPHESGRFSVYEEFVDKQAFEQHQRHVRESHWGTISRNVERHYSVRGLD